MTSEYSKRSERWREQQRTSRLRRYHEGSERRSIPSRIIEVATLDKSPRRDRILRFIRMFYLLQGYPPTINEITDGIHVLSSGLIHYHLHQLHNAGEIRPAGAASDKSSRMWVPVHPLELRA